MKRNSKLQLTPEPTTQRCLLSEDPPGATKGLFLPLGTSFISEVTRGAAEPHVVPSNHELRS